MSRIEVEKIAEAVMYEGYLLFPYRRSAMKNQQRWTFGGVYPPRYCEATGGDDPWQMQTQCLVEGDAATEIAITVRFLHVTQRKVAEIQGETRQFVEELLVEGKVYPSWEEAREREVPLRMEDGESALRLGNLLRKRHSFAIAIPAGSETETLFDSQGKQAGVILREWQSLQGEIEVRAEPILVPPGRDAPLPPGSALCRLTVRIANTAPLPEGQEMDRLLALQHTFVSTHTILRAQGGAFVSLLEPHEAYRQAAEACRNIKTWPVLVGETGERHTVLSSPIILYDYPQISPESQGNYFDATEIDELLALTVMSLTDAEKQEILEADLQGRELLNRTEALSEDQLLKMHAALRYLHS